LDVGTHVFNSGLVYVEDDSEFAREKTKPPLRYKILGLPIAGREE
jgi:hypothetical protein